MTAQGQYAAGDGSFVRSAGGAAGRGLVLVIIAVAIGAFLLRAGFDGTETRSAQSSTPSATADEASSDQEDEGDGAPADPSSDENGDPAEPTETTLPPPLPTREPSQVKVAAVNGTGTVGLAGRTAELLGVHGYVTGAKNAANVPVAVSVIYYRAGFSEDAKAVATHLRAPADIIAPAPEDVLALIANADEVADFNVFVIVGADEVIPV